MSAVSFAEEGDFETARELMKGDRRVLLAVRKGHMDPKTFRYAVNACKRISASLDVLYLSSAEGKDPALAQCISELTGKEITYRLVRESGCLKQAIIDYTNTERGVLFVVTESAENLDTECKGKGTGLSAAWQNLRCPLVVVADGV